MTSFRNLGIDLLSERDYWSKEILVRFDFFFKMRKIFIVFFWAAFIEQYFKVLLEVLTNFFVLSRLLGQKVEIYQKIKDFWYWRIYSRFNFQRAHLQDSWTYLLNRSEQKPFFTYTISNMIIKHLAECFHQKRFVIIVFLTWFGDWLKEVREY